MDQDREALQAIRGRPVTRPWPPHAFPAGTPVKMVADSTGFRPWPPGTTGTVSELGPPEPVQHPAGDPGELSYWIDFDEPSLDTDAVGSDRRALIWSRYLTATGAVRPPDHDVRRPA